MKIVKLLLRWLLAIFMIGAGVNHFLNPAFYLHIMPPYLPWHRELVYLSGVLEVAVGVPLLIPRFSRWAAWGVIAVLIAVFPANLHMALHTDHYPEVSPLFLWLRLPMQLVFIAWAYWFTRPERPK